MDRAYSRTVTERRLYLLRHAKSSWKDRGLADQDRPLAGRGRRAAKAMAAYLKQHGIEPQLVLCSTARRTRETLDRIAASIGDGDVRVERELYLAGAGVLLARLHEIPATVTSVMLIGHNPGMEELALLLARRGAKVRELEAKFPTGALATLAVKTGWAELDRGTAELVEFIRPRDL
jgi:phosphohistidine phosphatase